MEHKESFTIQSIFEQLPPAFDDFIKRYNNSVKAELRISLDEQIKYLLECYCNNCGVSYSYRSVYCDLAFVVLTEIKPDEEFPDLDDYAATVITDWDNFKHYDSGLNIEPTISTAFAMLMQDEVDDEHWIMFCQKLDKLIQRTKSFDIDSSLLLSEILKIELDKNHNKGFGQ